MKLIPTMPNPTITTFFLCPPWLSFSDPFTPSGPPSMGPALISSMGICGCQLLDIVPVSSLANTHSPISLESRNKNNERHRNREKLMMKKRRRREKIDLDQT